ncbi:MAG: uracil-xanthine permease family protein [Oscillospiraceae bacterium]
MDLIFNVKDKPKFAQLIVFAIQQVLAIMAATLAVPMIIGNGMSPAAALFGAGVGTLVYVLFTKANSPVFLGSSFAFINSMLVAFAGGVSMSLGFAGLIFGAVCAGLVYVIIAVIVKFVGVGWINKLMPAVVIGPTVAIIGLSLAGNAIGDLQTAPAGGSPYIAILCGLITLGVTMCCSVYGKKTGKLIPFIIGILSGYAIAAIFTVIGNSAGIDALKVINFDSFKELDSVFSIPDFTFLSAAKGVSEFTGSYALTIAVAYMPVAFVVFAEHIADHKNLSSIIGQDLLENPGLHRTLLGDGVGSIAGALFGGCPNTTYGESVGCVAITKNASVYTIITAAVLCMIISLFTPFVAFLNSIPNCVMGGVCMALYGFIAVSGLKMVQKVDLNDNRNLFVVCVILIAGIGGFSLSFGSDANGNAIVTITEIACALILGILTNILLNRKKS